MAQIAAAEEVKADESQPLREMSLATIEKVLHAYWPAEEDDGHFLVPSKKISWRIPPMTVLVDAICMESDTGTLDSITRACFDLIGHLVGWTGKDARNPKMSAIVAKLLLYLFQNTSKGYLARIMPLESSEIAQNTLQFLMERYSSRPKQFEMALHAMSQLYDGHVFNLAVLEMATEPLMAERIWNPTVGFISTLPILENRDKSVFKRPNKVQIASYLSLSMNLLNNARTHKAKDNVYALIIGMAPWCSRTDRHSRILANVQNDRIKRRMTIEMGKIEEFERASSAMRRERLINGHTHKKKSTNTMDSDDEKTVSRKKKSSRKKKAKKTAHKSKKKKLGTIKRIHIRNRTKRGKQEASPRHARSRIDPSRYTNFNGKLDEPVIVQCPKNAVAHGGKRIHLYRQTESLDRYTKKDAQWESLYRDYLGRNEGKSKRIPISMNLNRIKSVLTEYWPKYDGENLRKMSQKHEVLPVYDELVGSILQDPLSSKSWNLEKTIAVFSLIENIMGFSDSTDSRNTRLVRNACLLIIHSLNIRENKSKSMGMPLEWLDQAMPFFIERIGNPVKCNKKLVEMAFMAIVYEYSPRKVISCLVSHLSNPRNLSRERVWSQCLNMINPVIQLYGIGTKNAKSCVNTVELLGLIHSLYEKSKKQSSKLILRRLLLNIYQCIGFEYRFLILGPLVGRPRNMVQKGMAKMATKMPKPGFWNQTHVYAGQKVPSYQGVPVSKPPPVVFSITANTDSGAESKEPEPRKVISSNLNHPSASSSSSASSNSFKSVMQDKLNEMQSLLNALAVTETPGGPVETNSNVSTQEKPTFMDPLIDLNEFQCQLAIAIWHCRSDPTISREFIRFLDDANRFVVKSLNGTGGKNWPNNLSKKLGRWTIDMQESRYKLIQFDGHGYISSAAASSSKVSLASLHLKLAHAIALRIFRNVPKKGVQRQLSRKLNAFLEEAILIQNGIDSK